MDISQFLDVTCDVVDDVEEVNLDILPSSVKPPKKPAANSTPKTVNPLKRVNQVPSPLPPSKRAKPANFIQSPAVKKSLGTNFTPSPVNRSKNGTPGKVNRTPTSGGRAPIKASPATGPGNPISWKYKQLQENLYNGDIKKTDLLKDYEPERCNCKAPANPEDAACVDNCINRSLFTECDKEMCPQKERCSNQRLQKRQYAPGLERFMTQKKGWGVRARQSIPSGIIHVLCTLILEYMGELCTNAEFEKRMLTRYKGDTHHYCLAIDGRTVIDAQRAGSECRFVNHSCDPNCEMQKWNVNGLQRMAVFAKRDILPSEEITYDYNFSLFDKNHGQVCKCGAKNCRGVIGGKGKDYLITIDNNKKALVSNSPMSIGSQLTADAKFYSTKIPPAELTQIKATAPKFAHLENRQIKCTVCNCVLNYKVPGAVQRHPELGVIMCQACRGSYGRGGWARDQQGSDEFCRWCSEGGQIYLCDTCPKAFCHKCLKWNLGKKYLAKIDEEDQWHCLCCDGVPIRAARALYFAIHMYQKAQQPPAATNGKSSKQTPKKAAAKSKSSTPVQNGRSHNSSTPTSRKQQVPSLSRQQLPSTPTAAAGTADPTAAAVARNQIQQRHFVDAMLLEADRAVNRMKGMVNEIRKKWMHAGLNNTRNQQMIVEVTERIRSSFTQSIEGIHKADEKVVNLYKSNMSIPLKEEEKTNGGGSNILDVSVDEIEESETNNKDKSEENASDEIQELEEKKTNGDDNNVMEVEIDEEKDNGEIEEVIEDSDENEIDAAALIPEVQIDEDQSNGSENESENKEDIKKVNGEVEEIEIDEKDSDDKKSDEIVELEEKCNDDKNSSVIKNEKESNKSFENNEEISSDDPNSETDNEKLDQEKINNCKKEKDTSDEKINHVIVKEENSAIKTEDNIQDKVENEKESIDKNTSEEIKENNDNLDTIKSEIDLKEEEKDPLDDEKVNEEIEKKDETLENENTEDLNKEKEECIDEEVTSENNQENVPEKSEKSATSEDSSKNVEENNSNSNNDTSKDLNGQSDEEMDTNDSHNKNEDGSKTEASSIIENNDSPKKVEVDDKKNDIEHSMETEKKNEEKV